MKTRHLERTTERLAEKNEELKRFNYIISHDLKEPLRSIVSFSNLAQRESKGQEKLQEYLQYVIKGGRQLHDLIEAVLEFHRLDYIPKDVEEVDTNIVLDDVINSLRSLLYSQEGKVMYSNLPKIHSPNGVLFLVFKNLVENGIKYNQKPEPIVRINYKETPDEHLFYVSDNGIGIKPKYFEQIFVMFKRLHSRREFEGSGIGLAIVQKLLNKINGNIKVEKSILGEGTTFLISLPKEGQSPTLVSNNALASKPIGLES